MAATVKPTLSGAQIASQAIAADSTVAGTAFGLSAHVKEVLLYVQVTARTDGTFTPTLQGSVDGSTWIVLKSGTAITSVTQNFTSWVVEKDGALPPLVRAAIVASSVTSGGTANAKILIDKN